jgi:streptogramin lyase
MQSTKWEDVVMRPFFALLALACLTAAAETTPEARIEAVIPRYGVHMGGGFDSLWAMNGNKLVRINLADNSITEIPIEGAGDNYGLVAGVGLAVGEGAVWVPDVDRQVIYKVDPRTHQVAARAAAPNMAGGGGRSIGVGEGAVWVIAGAGNNELRRYSAETGNEQATIPLASASSDVLVAYGSVWITGTGNDELYRVDPTTDQVVATIDLHSRPRSLAAGEESVWVFNSGDGTIDQIDGKTGKLLATIETGAAERGAIAVGGGFVWVTTPLVPLMKIDPRTHSLRGKFNIDTAGYSGASTIRYGGGSVWISGPLIRRIMPPE